MKLYVKQRCGNSRRDFAYGLPETTFTQIWFETIDWQEAWPILGLNHSFNNFISDELDEEHKDDALLMAKVNSLLNCTRLYGKSCPTSLCLELKVSDQPEQIRKTSPEKPKVRVLEERLADSNATSVAIERHTSVAEAKPEESTSNKRKRNQAPEFEDIPKIKESVSNPEVEPHNRELLEDLLEAEREEEDDDDVRRGRRSRNQNPVHNPRQHFKQLMNGLSTQSSSRTRLRTTRQSSHESDTINQELRNLSGGFGGGGRFVYPDGTEVPLNKKRNGKSRQKSGKRLFRSHADLSIRSQTDACSKSATSFTPLMTSLMMIGRYKEIFTPLTTSQMSQMKKRSS